VEGRQVWVDCLLLLSLAWSLFAINNFSLHFRILPSSLSVPGDATAP
jgi:hypothetical protein